MKLRKDERDYGEHGKVNSVIGQGTTFSGECSVDGTLRIDGELVGTVRATKMVVIGRSGVVKGDIYVEEAIVGGKVFGNILATGRVELQSGSFLEGDVKTSRLVVEEGTIFNGRCSMGEIEDGTIKLVAEDVKVEKLGSEA